MYVWTGEYLVIVAVTTSKTTAIATLGWISLLQEASSLHRKRGVSGHRTERRVEGGVTAAAHRDPAGVAAEEPPGGAGAAGLDRCRPSTRRAAASEAKIVFSEARIRTDRFCNLRKNIW